MDIHSLRAGLVLAAALLSGCVDEFRVQDKTADQLLRSTQTVERGAQGVTERQARLTAQQPSCEVWLQVSHGRKAETVPATAKVETPSILIASKPLCIKEAGKPMAFTAPIELAMQFSPTRNALRTLSQLCQGGGITVSTENHKTVGRCLWNNRFHSRYTLDLRLWTDDQQPLNQHMRLVRVLRNGKLVFTWNETQRDHDLLIAGSTLEGYLMPYEADLDLRIVPAHVQVNADLLKAQAVAKTSAWSVTLSSLRSVAKALIGSKSLANGELTKIFSCYEASLQSIEDFALAFAGGHKPAEPVTTNETCKAEVETLTKGLESAGGQSLAQRYQQAHQQVVGSLKDAEDDLTRTLATLAGISQPKLDKAKARAREALQQWTDHPPPNTPAQTIRDAWSALQALDQRALQTAQLFDMTQGLALQLRRDAIRIAGDRDEQGRLFAAAAQSLGSPFVPWTDNPPLEDGEKSLSMKYADRLQGYFLVPWNLVSLRLSGVMDPTLGLTNAVPAIDLVGFRAQWAKSRFADFRMGVGAAYVLDKADTSVDPMAKDHSNLVVQVNASLANFKVGLGYAVLDGWNSANLRLLVGVDLVKLISGQNLEVK